MLINISMFYNMQITFKYVSDNVSSEKLKWHVIWRMIEKIAHWADKFSTGALEGITSCMVGYIVERTISIKWISMSGWPIRI